MAELDGRVIAIAGAAGGLGPTVARRLADAGATLAATDVDQERLDALVADLGPRRGPLRTAASSTCSTPDAARDGRPRSPSVSAASTALLHLVGGWKGGDPIATTPLEDYEWLHDLLVRTVQHTTRAFYEQLAASEHGRFVLVSSSQAQSPERHQRLLRGDQGRGRGLDPGPRRLASRTRTATANIVVINAILTPSMREENPDKEYPTFTSTEDLAEAIALSSSPTPPRR